MLRDSVFLRAAGFLSLPALAGCGGQAGGDEKTASIAQSVQAVSPGNALAGRQKFNQALSGTNDRSCATCHVEADHFMLKPENVQARPANDPLFNAIDADDPNATPLTFNNLRAGLVRITLELPDNVDLVAIPPEAVMFTPPDVSAQILSGWQAAIAAGQIPEIVTPRDRTISVWRAVPSVENTSYTAPYLFDARASSLEDQALGALDAHSQASHAIGNGELGLIADFERTLFTSNRAAFVNDRLLAGVPLGNIPDPEGPVANLITLTPAQAAGKIVYDEACAGCHGSATDNKITNRSIHDGLFFDLDSNGNLIFQPLDLGNGPVIGPDGNPIMVPRTLPPRNEEAINIGTTFISHIGQLAPQFFPLFNNQNGVKLPRYRLRFYTDGTRTKKIMDLPPLPVVSGGPPFTPAPDPNKPGALIVGSNFGPELFTTDPGRALITGDWADFEGIDVPQLRGIANTAPYFHDNSQATLGQLITTYSQFILPFLPQLDQDFPPVPPGTDRLTPQQKADLEAFLKTF
jgi:cytochrome c peroxidase